MRHWFTQPELALEDATIKRFEPSHWIVDFPRGSMASVTTTTARPDLVVDATFARKNDLVGLIFESEDRHVHIGHRRVTDRNYSRCTLRFRWRSQGLLALDAVNGPTLTIEGRDEGGAARTWFVRLWNYAQGEGSDAVVTLPFGALDAGFSLPAEAERVWPEAINRMFISLVPIGFEAGNADRFSSPPYGRAEMTDIECTGSGGTVAIKDAFVPEHDYRICTAYDDLYHLTPERVIDEIERLGFRKLVNHYVGMSHYPALTGNGLVDAAQAMTIPARRWHENFAALAAARNFDIIWSVSMELLEQLCPEAWKQRAWDGEPARTGYVPPSTLLSPAVPQAVAYLGQVAAAFVRIGVDAGLPALIQVGEPWWWVRSDNAICLYDSQASTHWPIGHVPIADVSVASSADAMAVLDLAGTLLSLATTQIVTAASAEVGPVRSHLLAYLPSIMREDAPEIVRANLPIGWASPAFDVLQLEDYEWVTEGRSELSRTGIAEASGRLGYATQRRHYLAGFVATREERGDWQAIMEAAAREKAAGTPEIFIWALPQVLRDGLTISQGEEAVDSFRDVQFPLEIGQASWVEPHFSTSIVTGSSGYEYRNVEWEQARLRFDVGPGLRSLADLKILLAFFRSVRGNAIGFRFRDPTDFSSAQMGGEPTASDVVLGMGDGNKTRFALIKPYGDGEIRRITRPVMNEVKVSVAGAVVANWSLSDGGFVEFAVPPGPGTTIAAGFLFDVPVRFLDSHLRISGRTHLAGEAVSVPLIEIKEG